MKKLLRVGPLLFLLAGGLCAANALQPIRQIDFRNFTFPWEGSFPDDGLDVPSEWHWMYGSPQSKLVLVNGRSDINEENLPQDVRGSLPLVTFESVTYGDLSADGAEDAAVNLTYHSGGTANWSYLYIYKLEQGRLKLLSRLESGSRADGGLIAVSIEHGMLVLEFQDAAREDGACCSAGFIRVRYRWRQGRFVEVGPREHGDLKQ